MLLLTCGDDSGRVARLWDVASAVEVTRLGLDDERFDYEPQLCSALSHDGKLIALGGDNTVSIVDAESGEILRRSDAHDNQVLAIAFSSDDQYLATGCRDASIGLWDVPSRTMIGLLLGHAEDVIHVRFSRDGRHLLSTSKDDTLRLWDLSTRKNTKTFRGHRGDVRKAMWSPDEQTIVSLDSAGMMIFWDPRLEQERARIAFADRRLSSFTVATTPPSLIVLFAGSNDWSIWAEDKPDRIQTPGKLE